MPVPGDYSSPPPVRQAVYPVTAFASHSKTRFLSPTPTTQDSPPRNIGRRRKSMRMPAPRREEVPMINRARLASESNPEFRKVARSGNQYPRISQPVP